MTHRSSAAGHRVRHDGGRARDGTDPARSFRGRRSLARANKRWAVVGAGPTSCGWSLARANKQRTRATHQRSTPNTTAAPRFDRTHLAVVFTAENRRTPLAQATATKTTDDTGPHRPASICPRSGVVAFPLPEPMTPPCDDERPTEHREIRQCPATPDGEREPARYQSRCIASRSAGTREPSLGLSVKATLALLGAPLPSLRSVAARP